MRTHTIYRPTAHYVCVTSRIISTMHMHRNTALQTEARLGAYSRRGLRSRSLLQSLVVAVLEGLLHFLCSLAVEPRAHPLLERLRRELARARVTS